ncbi:MAG TPA: HD domain-containing phosphohydrolase [Trueperaceae bacterium]
MDRATDSTISLQAGEGPQYRTDLLWNLKRQRSKVVQKFLWILLVVVAATMLVNILLLGREAFTVRGLVPNLSLLILLGVAIGLNRRHHFNAALILIIGVILVGASLPLFMVGIPGNEIALFLFFVPLVLAALLLNRWALYTTLTLTLAVVLLSSLLYAAGMLAGGPAEARAPWLPAVQFAIVLCLVAFFLDRFGVTLQEALRNSVEREVSLRNLTVRHRLTDEALVEEKHFNEVVIDSLPGIFFVADESGNLLRWNRNFQEVTGYRPGEVAKVRASDLAAGSDGEVIERTLQAVFADGQASAQASFVDRQGARVPFLLSGTRIEMSGAVFAVGVGVDRSEIDEARSRIQTLNEELQVRLERITALHEIDKAITGSLDLELTLDVVLQQVMRMLAVDASCILLFEPKRLELRYAASRGFRRKGWENLRLRLGEGQAGIVGLDRERRFISGADPMAAAFGTARHIAGEEFHAYVAVPLLAKGHLKGVLELYHRSPLTPDEDWFDFLHTLATQAAIALDDAVMFQDLERSNQELRLAYDTTIEGWARALDLRDEETEGHSRRVTEMALRLAQRMGVPDDELVHMRRGALLHDIGKMGVPDGILLKPAELTVEEREIMKRHTTYAFELLSPIAFLRPVLDIPYCHHERWDGSGYPRGLSGFQIPLAARIFSVVDVFDALTSDRPYRSAWSEDDALANVEEQSGRQFDPEVVEAFLSMIAERPSDG